MVKHCPWDIKWLFRMFFVENLDGATFWSCITFRHYSSSCFTFYWLKLFFLLLFFTFLFYLLYLHLLLLLFLLPFLLLFLFFSSVLILHQSLLLSSLFYLFGLLFFVLILVFVPLLLFTLAYDKDFSFIFNLMRSKVGAPCSGSEKLLSI